MASSVYCRHFKSHLAPFVPLRQSLSLVRLFVLDVGKACRTTLNLLDSHVLAGKRNTQVWSILMNQTTQAVMRVRTARCKIRAITTKKKTRRMHSALTNAETLLVPAVELMISVICSSQSAAHVKKILSTRIRQPSVAAAGNICINSAAL